MARAHEARILLLAFLGFTALILALLGDQLFTTDEIRLPSHSQGDAARYFIYQRLFAWSELAGGNIPLWNPHTFSGAPCVGIFQSAVFYPPNLIYLFLSVRTGIVAEMSLALLLMAFFTFAWLRGKGIGPLSCFLAAVVVIFGAACSLRVLAGQLSVLGTFAWWPLVLLSIDRLAARVSLGWALSGMLAITMMILAGHPPTVLMAGVVTALYCVPLLIGHPRALRLAAVLAAMGVAPLFLSAIQLWTGLGTAAEGVRSGGMTFEFATSHSFPPEQLLTLLAPGLFGDAREFHRSYFGRVFFWDATFFIGVISLMLAIHGALVARGRHRNLALGLSVLLALTAMGGFTPLYRIFYHLVPGFSFVRAPSKFLFFASVFASVLVGLGLDRLISSEKGVRRTALAAFGMAIVMAIVAVWAGFSPADSPAAFSPINLLSALWGRGDFIVEGELSDWHAMMWKSCALASATAATAAVLIALARRSRWAAGLLVLAAVLELLVFARSNRGETRVTVELDLRPKVVEAYRMAGATSRVIETAAPSNVAVAQRNFALWGYDPVILGRYVRFMAFTQGTTPERLKNPTLVRPETFHPLHSMLRGRYQVLWRTHELVDHPNPLPQFVFVRRYEVIPEADALLAAMGRPGFDPRRTALLESEPSIRPVAAQRPGSPARIWILDRSSDHFDLEVELDSPALLVVTDAYSRGWQVRSLHGSDQSEYELLPANYVLRAIPLSAGHHRLRMEYRPIAYVAGAWSTAISGAVFLSAAAWWALGRLARRGARASPRRERG